MQQHCSCPCPPSTMNRRSVLPLSVYLLAQMATISGGGPSFNASDLQLSFTNGSTHQSMFYFFDQSYINALPENRCSLNDRIAMSRCEPAARYEWDVQDTDFVSYPNDPSFFCYPTFPPIPHLVHAHPKVLLLRVGQSPVSGEPRSGVRSRLRPSHVRTLRPSVQWTLR